MNITRINSRLRSLWNATGGSPNCGWMVDEVAVYLYGLIKFYKPELVIQTGHLWGKSALFVLEALTDGFLVCERVENIEREGDPAFKKFVQANVPQRKLPAYLVSVDPDPLGVEHWDTGINLLLNWYEGFFEFKHIRSDQFFQSFETPVGNILVIVDGDHTREGCLKDLNAANNLHATCIVVDDTEWLPELKNVTKFFASANGYQYVCLPHYNGLTLLVKEK